jgi:hypothetical protein
MFSPFSSRQSRAGGLDVFGSKPRAVIYIRSLISRLRILLDMSFVTFGLAMVPFPTPASRGRVFNPIAFQHLLRYK